MRQTHSRLSARSIQACGTILLGCMFATASMAAPPGEPFKELENRVDELAERMGSVEADVKDIDERLSEVVEVVDVAEAFDMCVRVLDGELGGMPGPHWIFSGCNVHVRAKNLATDAPTNGRGNLIVGYNEGRCVTKEPIAAKNAQDDLQFPKACLTDAECVEGAICDRSGRTGSHNLIVGHQHRYPSFGGILGGRMNEAGGEQSTVAAGTQNKAIGRFSAASGGSRNAAGGFGASVTGGTFNVASGDHATVAGGSANAAAGWRAHISGGDSNEATGNQSVVVGGGSDFGFAMDEARAGDCSNKATGHRSVVVGGCANEARFLGTTIVGGLGNQAEGEMSVITGGADNLTDFFASGSVVSGGLERSVEGNVDWRAGGKFEDD